MDNQRVLIKTKQVGLFKNMNLINVIPEIIITKKLAYVDKRKRNVGAKI